MNNKDSQNRVFVTNSSVINKNTAHETQVVLAKYQLFYSITGLVLGLACIFGGVYLFIQGATGEMDWSLSIFGAKSNIVQAAPGAVLFIVGLFVVIVTKYKYKHITLE